MRSICFVTRSRSAVGSFFLSSFMRLLYHWLHALSGRPLTNRGTNPSRFDAIAARLVTPRSMPTQQALLTDCLDRVHEDVTAFNFVLVLGQSWASCELGRVFFVGFESFFERCPVFIEEYQHL